MINSSVVGLRTIDEKCAALGNWGYVELLSSITINFSVSLICKQLVNNSSCSKGTWTWDVIDLVQLNFLNWRTKERGGRRDRLNSGGKRRAQQHGCGFKQVVTSLYWIPGKRDKGRSVSHIIMSLLEYREKILLFD